MQVTALVENTAARKGLGAEHGLSLLIEIRGRSILFDAGQSGLFAENATLLGLDLKKVEFAVLSHGHYDHGGGLGRFLEINSISPVCVHPKAFEPHYHGPERYIGLDPDLRGNPRFHLAENGSHPLPGMTVFCSQGRKNVFPFLSPELTVMKDEGHAPDDFDHEIYLLVEEDGKRVLFSGCSHKGILNVMDWFRPDIFIGGFHLSSYPLDEELTANNLKSGPIHI